MYYLKDGVKIKYKYKYVPLPGFHFWQNSFRTQNMSKDYGRDDLRRFTVRYSQEKNSNNNKTKQRNDLDLLNISLHFSTQA